jgi:hypothetical protein
MQDTTDSVNLEAAMYYSENLVIYWLVRKVISFLSYDDKFIPVNKSRVYRAFKAMNFGELLKAWSTLFATSFMSV